ncbi:hypothetical protein Tco_0889005 [Tanacetum coccineum]
MAATYLRMANGLPFFLPAPFLTQKCIIHARFTLNNLELALNLAKRANLPGAENLAEEVVCNASATMSV